jgi:hypothetical protein
MFKARATVATVASDSSQCGAIAFRERVIQRWENAKSSRCAELPYRPSGATCRYSVCCVITSSAQSAPALVSRLPVLAMASGRGGHVRLAAADAPARTGGRKAGARRSVMSSNSATAAKMPKTTLPAAVVVVDRRALAGEHP